MIDRITTQPLYAVQAKRHVHPDGRRGGNTNAGQQDGNDRHDTTQPDNTEQNQYQDSHSREILIHDDHTIAHTELFDETAEYVHPLVGMRLYGRQSPNGSEHHDSHSEGAQQAARIAAYVQRYQHSVTDERI
ncbi:MAG: hypothetical protein JNL32_13690 [Candidatus Kapabacteria bacterium]|nr:hypothetical protein [Candidatus Kapabacteria bacterium]